MEQTPIFIFDRDDNLRLVLEPKTYTAPETKERPLVYINGVYVEELNGQETLEFEVPYTDKDDEVAWIEGDGRAVIRNQDGDLVEFIIRQVHDENGEAGLVKRVFCEAAEYELNDEWLTGYAPGTPVTLRTALGSLLQGTRFEPGEIMASELRTVNLGPMSVKAGITELLVIFGGEKRARVEVAGNRITRRYVDILSRRGTFTGKRFEYGKDIQSIKREIDYSQVKTALYGLGESTANDGPRVDFADVVWSKANGDPVDKPAGQRWVGDPEALARYGYDGGTRHRFGVHESQTGDPGQLLLETWQELQRRSWPIVTYELDVIVLEQLVGRDHEQVRLGDGVYVIDRDMKPITALEAHVIRIDHDLNDPSRSRVLLGNFRDSFFAENERLRSIERIINDRRGNWDYKETPEGAQGKADDAFQRAIEEAERMIEEAELDLSEALARLDEAEQTLQDIQQQLDDLDLSGVLRESEFYNGVQISDALGLEAVRSDELVRTILNATHGIAIQRRDSTSDPWTNVFYVDANTQRLTLDGDILARNLTLAGNVNAQNAVITGTLIGSQAVLLEVDIEDADIIDANIQNATITGTLVGVDGTFVGTLNGNTINGATINGGLIRTATTGTRVEITSNQVERINFYNENNVLSAAIGFYSAHGNDTLTLRSHGTIMLADFSNNPQRLFCEATIATSFVSAPRIDVNRVIGYTNADRIYFGYSDRMMLTDTDSYPHYGLVLGQVMIKGLDSATQQVQIRNRNDTAYRDLVLRDMYCTGNGYFGPSESYMYMRSTTTYGYIHSPAGGNHYLRFSSDGQVAIYVDGTARHIFQPTGSKSGGSFEFSDGKVLGMSPIDSPQAPIEYLLFDVEVTEEGTKVFLDERFAEIVNGKYAVFVGATDKPVTIEEKRADSFIVKGPAQKVDLRLIGLRKDIADQFWVDMRALDEEEEENE